MNLLLPFQKSDFRFICEILCHERIVDSDSNIGVGIDELSAKVRRLASQNDRIGDHRSPYCPFHFEG